MSTTERKLNLSKSLVVFDLETTGTKPELDRIVELGAIKLLPNGERITYHSKINPTIPIPKEASQIHGISDDMVTKAPKFADIAIELESFFKDSDLAGYNIKRFDVPLLMQEFHRCKLYPINLHAIHIVDCCSIFMMREPRDLSAAARYYAKIETFDAHSALGDIEVTIEVLNGQLKKYDDIGLTPQELCGYISEKDKGVDLCRKFILNADGEVVYNFGKHFGKPVSVDLDYLRWIKDNDSMPVETRMTAKRLLLEFTKPKETA